MRKLINVQRSCPPELTLPLATCNWLKATCLMDRGHCGSSEVHFQVTHTRTVLKKAHRNTKLLLLTLALTSSTTM